MRLQWVGSAVGAAMLASLAWPSVAIAHEGVPPAPHDLWRAWYWQPTILFGLLVAAWVYARGTGRLWARAGRGVGRWRAVAWTGGLFALLVALVSPLHRFGEALFSAHMGQHLLLAAVAAPLLVLGAPLLPLLWALPLSYRRRLRSRWWRRAAWVAHAVRRRLLPLWLVHVGALWAWHAPVLYELALRSEIVHVIEHVTLLGTALLFWWAAIPPNMNRPARSGASVPALFALALQGGALGGLLLASGTPWYPAHAPWVGAWGLTPLADQQLAGLLMMLPGDAIYLGAALALAAAWLRPVASGTGSTGAHAGTTAGRARDVNPHTGPATKGVEP